LSFGLKLFTGFHVILSLIGILSGFLVAFGLLTSRRLEGWTAVFLSSTLLTSVTGFFFPFHGITPGLVIGVVSLILLALAILGRNSRNLEGGWRKTYAITSMIAPYLNFFIFIVQLFEKVPALKAIAPTQSEAPFKIAQLAALVLFIVLTVLSAIRFHGERLTNAPTT
jgi:hypothetical protein